MILSIIFISLSVLLIIIGGYYLILNRNKYVIRYTDVLLISFYIFIEISYFILFNLSLIVVASLEVAYIFWIISIILRILRLSIPSAVVCYVFIRSKIRILPLYIYAFFGGILGTYLLFTNSFQVVILNNNYIYIPKDDIFLIFNYIFNGLAMCITIITYINGYKRITFTKMKKLHLLLTIQYNIIIIIYQAFLLNPYIFSIRYLYLILVLILLVIEVFIIIAEFDLFLVVTNKVYDFIIFHRSGVLLFSYNLARNEEIDDSILKGSILIGINHILSNFINKKDMLNLIKMKDGDIVFEYNNQYGCAILTVVDHKTKMIEKAVQLYMKKFTEKNKSALNKINKNTQLIDTSKFKNAKNILYDYFKPFMTLK